MATVHNAYYNSPWIADAARNLASALAPQDPEKTLEMQREKWKFQRLQELSRIEDEERGLMQAGDSSIAALLAGAGQQPTAPTSPGEAAYFSANPEAAGPAGMDDATFQGHVQTALKGKRTLSDVVLAAGPRGSAYAGKLGLLDDRQLAALGLQGVKGDQAWQRATLGQEGSWARAMLADDRYRDLALQNAQLQRERDAFKAQADKESDERKNTAKPPTKISPTEDRDMRYGVEDWATTMVPKTYSGQPFQLPPDVLTTVVDIQNDLYRDTNDAPNSREEAIRFVFGDSPVPLPARDPWGFGDEDEYPEEIPLRDGKTLDALRAEWKERRAAAQGVAPAAPGQPPPLIAAPGGDVSDTRPPVPVYSIEEARLLPPDTRFIVMPEGRRGTTPPVLMR